MVLSAQKQAPPAFSGRSVAELEQVIKDRLKHAVHALATDQPNLACLYMKRALEHIAEVRVLMKVSRVVNSVSDFFSDLLDNVLDILAPVYEGVKKAATQVLDFVVDVCHIVAGAFQSDFALAAPQ